MILGEKAAFPPKMGHKEILELVEDDLKAVEESIHLNYQSSVAMVPLVSGHLTNGGGKRLRPMFVLLSSGLCGYSGEKAVIHSTVVEYIHAATLLHDDVVDDSDTRRGRESANAKFGNPVSVLVGDYLFAKSFSLMSGYSSAEIIRSVSDATRHLAEGEILQMVHIGNVGLTEEEYLDVIFRKTAALITACCQIGGMLGEATPAQRRGLEIFGKNIGIAFQIVDDLLDFVADEKTLGKPVGHDFTEGHITLPFIHAYRQATPGDRAFMEGAARDGEAARDRMPQIVALIKKYDGVAYAAQTADRFRKEALEAVESAFAPSPYLDALTGLADYVINRDH